MYVQYNAFVCQGKIISAAKASNTEKSLSDKITHSPLKSEMMCIITMGEYKCERISPGDTKHFK